MKVVFALLTKVFSLTRFQRFGQVRFYPPDDINPENKSCVNFTVPDYCCEEGPSELMKNCYARDCFCDAYCCEADDCCDDYDQGQCAAELGSCYQQTGSCPAGREVNDYDTACIDIDECVIGTHNCDATTGEICENSYGSFECKVISTPETTKGKMTTTTSSTTTVFATTTSTTTTLDTTSTEMTTTTSSTTTVFGATTSTATTSTITSSTAKTSTSTTTKSMTTTMSSKTSSITATSTTATISTSDDNNDCDFTKTLKNVITLLYVFSGVFALFMIAIIFFFIFRCREKKKFSPRNQKLKATNRVSKI